MTPILKDRATRYNGSTIFGVSIAILILGGAYFSGLFSQVNNKEISPSSESNAAKKKWDSDKDRLISESKATGSESSTHGSDDSTLNTIDTSESIVSEDTTTSSIPTTTTSVEVATTTTTTIASGPSESDRMQIFYELVEADNKATNEGEALYPVTPTNNSMDQLTMQAEEINQLRDKYRAEVRAKYNITEIQESGIDVEGITSDWPMPSVY